MSVGFIPNITLLTRISETAATLIDNIFTNNVEKSHILGVLSTHFSDHQMITTTLNYCVCQKKNLTLKASANGNMRVPCDSYARLQQLMGLGKKCTSTLEHHH